MFAIGALACTALGCGEFVEYGEGPDAGVVGGDGDAGGLVRRAEVDHSLFDGLLRQFVSEAGDGTNRVDYDGIGADADAWGDLDAYLELIGSTDALGLDAEQRLAFWINAYNASVIDGVLEDYGGDAGFSTEGADGSFGFFKRARHTVSGRLLSLDEIEHAVIRGDASRAGVDPTSNRAAALAAYHDSIWAGGSVDARIHVALNCAALSCPNLPTEAHAADTLDAQLEQGTAAFLADASKGAGPDGISSLFDWFAADFERDAGSVADFIETHREDGLDGVNLDQFLDYDWSLNIK